MSRTENGKSYLLNGRDVVLADLIAKTSGVSLSTVCRVIAAQDAISMIFEFDGASSQRRASDSDLTDFAQTPLALADEARSAGVVAAHGYMRRHCDVIPKDQRAVLKLTHFEPNAVG